jgi:hypothetical protein
MEENNMTTTTNKDKPGKTPSAPDKKAPNMPYGLEHRIRMREKLLALARERGYKEGRLEGAIIRIPEGTDII